VTYPSLDLLVLTDLHYIGVADDVCTIEARRSDIGPTLVREAAQRLRQEGIQLDLVVLLGDLVNDGLAAGAEHDLAEIARAVTHTGLPFLAVPGNHDGDMARTARLLNCPPGLHEIGGYGFVIFHDHVAPDHVTTRSEEDLALPEQLARQRPDLPLIALQHNPLHPRIDHEYPFIPVNVDRILPGYRAANVLLSLSGHYHPGQPAHPHHGTIYMTLPAGCEAPYAYAHVRLRDRNVEIEWYALEEG
jgi:predicted MPP superfamily phosphohydrolase